MRIRIAGAGVMGRGIAQWAVTGGHTVELCDARAESVAEAVAHVHHMLERSVHKGRTAPQDAAAALERLHPLESVTSPGDDVDLVVEAVREDLDTKTDLLRRLEQVVTERTVFATNTSSLPVTRIAAGLRDPSRLVGLHFFNPVPLMKIVEVVPGAHTRPDIPPAMTALVRRTGHAAVVVADTPGFLVNHAGRGLVTEALALWEEAVCDTAGVDRVAREVLGLRMGPFQLMDLTGLDVTAAVNDAIWQGFRHSDRLRPSFLTPNRVTAGLHGRKTGRGFYTYAPKPAGRPADAAAPPTGRGPSHTLPAAAPGSPERAPRPVRVVGRDAAAGALARSLEQAGVPTATTSHDPSGHTLFLVPTWGTTVAEAVAAHGLPAARTAGVDPLSVGTSCPVLAVTPAVDPDAAREAAAVLARIEGPDGPATVALAADTAGSVAQRLLSSLVSVAASLAERRLAEPGDIDTAVTAGLGYPSGPLAWGDSIGADRLLELQRNLHRATGDPRYRPTRWVTDRARLGLPLTRTGTLPEHIGP